MPHYLARQFPQQPHKWMIIDIQPRLSWSAQLDFHNCDKGWLDRQPTKCALKAHPYPPTPFKHGLFLIRLSDTALVPRCMVTRRIHRQRAELLFRVWEINIFLLQISSFDVACVEAIAKHWATINMNHSLNSSKGLHWGDLVAWYHWEVHHM